MAGKYIATFPSEAGQFAGQHRFRTKQERRSFLDRTSKRGVDLSTVKLQTEVLVAGVPTIQQEARK
jgi:hypothetical protein